MLWQNIPTSLPDILRCRRQKLARIIDFHVILWSGDRLSRNFPANKFPFRAHSSFLYFAGLPLEKAAIRLESGNLELFIDDPHPESALWYGETPTRAEIATMIGADGARPISELSESLQDDNRALELTKAIISLRLIHDAGALAELRQAAAVTVAAHKAGMAMTSTANLEAEVRAAMEAVIIGHNMTQAYNSIVTVHGEVLHNEHYHHPLQPGDLILADVGAETYMGWAADITRTWPVSGKFSATQRDIYDVVLAAHDACIEKVAPSVEYEEIHFLAAHIIAEGLVNLGILRGKAEDLVNMDAHALFFPHGIGHLLGLDVHDMEEFGDLAGYSLGRSRSDRFGLSYLRLNRPLCTGMLVTIEPGFYQVPAILNQPQIRDRYQDSVNWERLEKFADVRGIRIEDDVLVTKIGREVLTEALPTKADAVEDLI